MNRAEKRRNKKLADNGAKRTRPIHESSSMPAKQEQTLAIQQAIDLAVQHHKAGDLPKAEAIYQQILQTDPNQPVALHLLGVIVHQAGKNNIAVDLITKAIAINPDYVGAHSNLGNALKALGRLDEAVVSYSKAITINPDLAEVHSSLGVVLKVLGRLDEAISSYQKALAIKPDYAEAHNNLGNALYDQGKFDEAMGSFHRATNIKPNYAEAHSNLGNAFQELGQLDEAAASYNDAISIKPDYAEAHSNLGAALQKLEQFDEAVASYNKALNINPDYAEAHNNLGNVLKIQGKLNEAVASYNKALTIKPDLAKAHKNLGNTHKKLGNFDEAVASYHRALFIKPDSPDVHNNLGNALQKLGQIEEAIESLHKALAIKPDLAEAHYNLGVAHQGLGDLGQALTSYHRATAIKPSYTEAHSNLGNVLKAQGKLNEAVASYYNALTIKPDYAEVHSNLLFCMNNSELYSQKDIYAESCLWEAAHGLSDAALRIEHPHHDCSPERRLRIGYISPDFRKHSVSYFVLSLIASHDRNQFEVFCYSQVPNPDNKTQHLRNLSDCWRSIVGMTMNEIAECIRGDAIDILVDLTGHTANNLLQVFTKRPAPLQVTWLGYPNTTGLLAMNYRLIDAITDPVGPDDNLHSEQLVRLPNGFLCYTPDAEATPIKVPPVLPSGVVTFGSFNNLSKITLSTVSTWARILEATPKSRLLLKNASLADVETRRRYLALFVERGIDIERLEFLSHISSESAHLETYNRIDIGLDTFPYNGTTTTCEALWMGVPVICLRGDRHASRVGASILTRVGQPNLIAETIDDYVAVAGALAKDQARLTTLRQSLRPAMATSPLCDAQGFTRDVETAYKDMWRVWCKSI
jgi:protein O-GlcNAc transferase